MKLPGFSIELWTKQALEDIGNTIEKFAYVDPRCLGAPDKWVTWILIEKEYRGVFLDHIGLRWGETNLTQRLGYLGVPFYCSLCHHMGHIVANCPWRIDGRNYRRNYMGVPNKFQHDAAYYRGQDTRRKLGTYHGAHTLHYYVHGSSHDGISLVNIPSSPFSSEKSDPPVIRCPILPILSSPVYYSPGHVTPK